MNKNRRQVLGGIAAGCSLMGTAWGQAGLRKVVAAQPVHAVNYLPHIIAATQNYMADEGLDFKLITSGGGSKLREIVAAGQVQFGVADSTHVIQLNNRGKPAKMIFGIDNRPSITNIVVRADLFDKGITSVEKLANYKRPDGAKPIIAVSTFGGGQHIYSGYIFDKLNIYDKMNWLAGGGTTTMLGGLQSQKFDAIVASPGWQFAAVEKNFGRVIFDASDDAVWNAHFGGPIPSTCAYALQSTINESPEIVQSYVNGLYRATRWMEKATAEKIWDASGDKWFGALGEQVSLKEIALLKPLFNYSGLINAASFANAGRVWFRERAELKEVSYAQAIDTRFIEKSRQKFG